MLYFTARLILPNQATDARFNLNLLIMNYITQAIFSVMPQFV